MDNVLDKIKLALKEELKKIDGPSLREFHMAEGFKSAVQIISEFSDELNDFACVNSEKINDKVKEILTIMKVYEATFDWGFNDHVHSAIAHAVYGILTDKDYFLEEYKELLSNEETLRNIADKLEENLADVQDKKNLSDWIYCEDRMPEEYDTMFAKFKGTDKWDNCMFEKTSYDVNVTVEYADGKRKVLTLHTNDGKWATESLCKFKVIAWKPLPKPLED